RTMWGRSGVTWGSRFAIPALLTRTSREGCEAANRRAASRTEAKDARSISRTSALPPAAVIPSTTALPLAASLAPITTFAPFFARARAVSRPIPPVAPVTRTVLPEIQSRSAAIHAIFQGRGDTIGEVARPRLAGLAAALWLAGSGLGGGSETDNLTYRYVPLEDSAPKLNRAVNELLDEVLRKTNEKIAAHGADRASDAEAELRFAQTYSETVLKKLGDRLLPVIGTCIEKNDCPGWPQFERIPLKYDDIIYDEARYNKVATAFLSPTFQLCGVRLGTDKLTHLFAHGFFYYNAVRAGKAQLENGEAARRMGLADERGLMGA